MQKNNNTVKAVNRNVRSGTRKINVLLKNIRGQKADTAIRNLSFARQRIAFDIKKTLLSAISNAENNYQYDIDDLYVSEAYVGKSIVLKRFRPRAKGRASGIKKPYSNVTIILSENLKNKNFFKTSLKSVIKAKGKKEMETVSFLKIIKEKSSELGNEEKNLTKKINVGFSRGEKKKNGILEKIRVVIGNVKNILRLCRIVTKEPGRNLSEGTGDTRGGNWGRKKPS